MTQQFRQGKRRRLTKFRLDEISAVDNPAQVHARAALTKRNDDATKEACGGDYRAPIVVVTSEEDGHAHAIRIYGGERGGETTEARSPGPTEEINHAHPWSMDADGAITIGANRGHTHSVDQRTLVQAILSVTKRCAESGEPVPFDPDLLAFVEKAGSSSEDPSMPNPTPITSAPTAEEFAKLQGELARLSKVAELTDAHRAHFHKLADDTAKAAFLAKSVTEREAELAAAVAKAAESDPIVYEGNDGTKVRKSDGETVLALAKRADLAEKKAALAEAAAQDAAIEKRAGEFTHIPGDLDVRKAIVKAFNGIADPAIRTKAFEVLKAGNDALGGAFEKRGKLSGPHAIDGAGLSKAGAEDKLDTLAKARVAKSRESGKELDYYDAYAQVSAENPQLLEVATGKTGG